jgi:ATP/maltotriose-dependent transcriptional regulator MalT/DNA-binding SARP family transcriptional activator
MAGSMLARDRRMTALPIQPAKIHCPPPRDDTLSRERLNSWMERAVAGRLVLVVAEAGFGKTTLLADWARHTTRATAWYRLESDDRDWLTFIRHVVAGGLELDAGFAPETFRLLMELESGGTTRQELTMSLAREVAEFGIGSPHGFTLILDDYHVIDGSPETEPIVKALVDRTAPGFSVVISTRAMPTFSIGRVRARGGVMTLEGAELCFDVPETTRLFRDAYRRPLDDDVVTDLIDRTDGWPALLTLVRTGLEDGRQTQARALVAHLNPSRGDLYEFLAEEVLASLSPELQHFLSRVALLTGVDLASAMLVDDRPADEVAASITLCERLGLLTRPDRESPHHFHALVQEFLVARLTDEIGADRVSEMHRRLARAFEGTDWFATAWHFRAAGEADAAADVIDAAIPEIIAAGRFELVRQFLDGSAGSVERVGALVLRCHVERERGNQSRSTALAERAVADATGTKMAGLALLNLVSARGRLGFDEGAVELASQAMQNDLTTADRQVAEASVVVWGVQEEGSLASAAEFLANLAIDQDRAGHSRYAAVTRVNLSGSLLWLGRTIEAQATASRAELDLGFAPTGAERVAATAVWAAARLQSGHLEAIDRLSALIDTGATPMARDEAAIETAHLLATYDSIGRAEAAAARLGELALGSADQSGGYAERALVMSTIAFRRGDHARATEYLAATHGRMQDTAGKFRVRLLATRIALARGDRSVESELAELARLASAQESPLLERLANLLSGTYRGALDGELSRLTPEEMHLASTLAEEVCRNIPTLTKETQARVLAEARLRPARWASALRLEFAHSPMAAEMLAEMGSPADAAAMRAEAASRKWLRPLAARITRRLAPPVLIRDLGSVTVSLGGDEQERVLRRKVLGLLCFVSSRPGMAASRDEALDAIWPDLGPDTAANSLHQTIYYLRRVLEPAYKEGMSAGYVAFDGEVLSLDDELVDSLSRQCWRLIARARSGTADVALELLRAYRGTYALDFAYEEWAIGYRETLHAAVLATVECAVQAAILDHRHDAAIELAQRMLAVDPLADAVELGLLRAYKAGARHAAAAEQYAHYASYLRGELGTEPPAFDDI